MKKLLKKLALLPLFCGLVLTSACSNDDDNGNDNNNDIPTSWFDGTITATVVNGNDYNDLISSVVYGTATGIWSNGGFTITLPTIPLDQLTAITIPGLIISDNNTRIYEATFIRGLDSEGNLVGELHHIKEEENSFAGANFIYVDRDVTITGLLFIDDEGYFVSEGDFPLRWNVSLKKGWNWMYFTTDETGAEMSTRAVSGMRWYFENWSREFSAPMATKNTTQNRSVFSRLGR